MRVKGFPLVRPWPRKSKSPIGLAIQSCQQIWRRARLAMDRRHTSQKNTSLMLVSLTQQRWPWQPHKRFDDESDNDLLASARGNPSRASRDVNNCRTSPHFLYISTDFQPKSFVRGNPIFQRFFLLISKSFDLSTRSCSLFHQFWHCY